MRHYETDQRTIGHVLADKAARIGGRPFLRMPGRTVSYAELDEMTNRYARGFASLGIGRGDHVAMMLPNCPEFLFALCGLGKLGAAAVPLNTAAKGELQQPRSPADREHDVRICMMVPASRELTDGFAERYGITVTSVYAMTENCAVCVFSPDEPPGKAPSAGRVRDHVSVQIVDDDGRELPPGQVGEIRIRPNERGIIMAGYYKMAEATVAATRDLWFHTGDRGWLDPDGYLYFAGRKKEAIRRRGENISAYEVETILCRHPAVLEAAAVPVPSELGEDDVMAYVVLAPGAEVSYPELIEFCSQQMAYYMVPRYLRFTGELPKTPSEKVEKYKLKVAAAENRAQLWDRENAGITARR